MDCHSTVNTESPAGTGANSELRELAGVLEATSRRLRESEAVKGHFLSNVRNEINNPLAAIIGFAGQLMDGGLDEAEAAASGRFIYEEARELSFQLENVFAAAGLEAGLEMPDPAPVDAALILREVIDRLEHRSVGREIGIRCDFAAPLPVRVDPRFLQIIAGNLLANALEYGPPGSIVTIAAAVAAGQLLIEVIDQGPGVASAYRETIYDRFRQLDRGRCKSHRGLGLGLSVSRALAELAGGSLAIDAPPGGGSSFIAHLPSQTADATEADVDLMFAETVRY